MIIKNDIVVDFKEALYNTICECGSKIEWEACFDADGTSYISECCGNSYYMIPHSVKLEVYPK